MTAASTLTDRYVWAVQRSLPEAQRADIDRELRGTIADTIDAKIEAGTKPDVAERETLTELGDPYKLAPGYADRPLHLIGPALFPDYIRLLQVLYFIVLPIVVVVVFLVAAARSPSTASRCGRLRADLARRSPSPCTSDSGRPWCSRSSSARRTTSATGWNPDSLPELPQRRRGEAERRARSRPSSCSRWSAWCSGSSSSPSCRPTTARRSRCSTRACGRSGCRCFRHRPPRDRVRGPGLQGRAVDGAPGDRQRGARAIAAA